MTGSAVTTTASSSLLVVSKVFTVMVVVDESMGASGLFDGLKIHYSASEWKHGGIFMEVVSCTRGEAPTL